MYKRGKAMGLEARLKGVNVLLSPAMGPLGRHPAGGRNWEGKRAQHITRQLIDVNHQQVLGPTQYYKGLLQPRLSKGFRMKA